MRLLILIMLSLLLGLSVTSYADATKPRLFIGKDTAGDTQLWETDNTEQGTKVFTYLTKTPNGNSTPYALGVVGKWGLFASFTPETGYELWRTDGAPQGTSLLKEFLAGSKNGLYFLGLNKVMLNKRLMFWSYTPEGLTLTTSDGTPEGTQALKSFPKEMDVVANETPEFYAFNNLHFFWIKASEKQAALWRTDGTSEGTQLVVDAINISNIYRKQPITGKDAAYFLSGDSTYRSTIWRTDGFKTEALYDLAPLVFDIPALLTVNDSILVYYQMDDTIMELWTLDLATCKTQLLHHFDKPPSHMTANEVSEAFEWQGKFYAVIELRDNEQNFELWVGDLNTHYFEKLMDLPNPNLFSEHGEKPEVFTFAKRLYVFTKDDDRPADVWVTDGTKSGTMRLLIAPHHSDSSYISSVWSDKPSSYIRRGEYLIFPTSSAKGRELVNLWSLSTVEPLRPILLGEFASPKLLRPAPNDQGELLYFMSNQQRFQTDGTPQGTKAVDAKAMLTEWETQTWREALNDYLLALPTDPPSLLVSNSDLKVGQEPWVIKMDDPNLQLLSDINTHPASSMLEQMYQVGAYWYFVLNKQLWVSDGTIANTHPVLGIPNSEKLNSYKTLVQNDALYSVTENQNHQTLWKVQAGNAQVLRKFDSIYVDLQPSKTGIYEKYLLENGEQLIYRSATGATQIIWQRPKDSPEHLQQLLETSHGLLYIVHTSSPDTGAAASQEDYSLWLKSKNGEPAILLGKNLDSRLGTLMPLADEVYVSNGDYHNPILYRIDFNAHELLAVPTSQLTDPETGFSKINAANDPYIVDGSQLWYWDMNTMAKPQLLQEFPPNAIISLPHRVNGIAYFNVDYLSDDYISIRVDLWSSQGTPETTKRIKAGLAMGN